MSLAIHISSTPYISCKNRVDTKTIHDKSIDSRSRFQHHWCVTSITILLSTHELSSWWILTCLDRSSLKPSAGCWIEDTVPGKALSWQIPGSRGLSSIPCVFMSSVVPVVEAVIFVILLSTRDVPAVWTSMAAPLMLPRSDPFEFPAIFFFLLA